MLDLFNTVIADRYPVERELGRGGMASVWLAHDPRHGRMVAIKVIHGEVAGAMGLDRFLKEIAITARLQHPNVVPILDSGLLETPDGISLPWYAMAYLDGESLRARLEREQQLPVQEAIEIARVAGGALAAAHRHGIVHRDIKPENIFLSAGHVYLVDFGIAKALSETAAERLTGTGQAIGTPAYMSPEQAMAERVDARTDQYSLATVLYEMLVGEPPFTGPTAQAVFARRLTEPARPIRPVRSTVPDAVERAVLQALERAPADRFPDMDAFVSALQGSTTGERSTGWARPGARWVGGIAGLLAVILLGGWLAASRRRAPDPQVIALYQRGVRGYDRRTANGIVESIADFNGAVARDSGYGPAWTGLAKAYTRAYERGFAVPGVTRDSVLRRAIAAADRATITNPGGAETWLARALVTRIVDPTEMGPPVRAAREAIRLDSANGVAWHTLAISLAETGNLAEATEDWRRCVRPQAFYIQCVAFLALAHMWHRQYDSAAAWADSAIELDPTYLLARTSAGEIAVERGEFSRATAAYDAALRVSSDVEVVNDLAGSAMVAARAGRIQEARTILRRADSLAAGYVPLPLHSAVYLAHTYAALGDRARASALLGGYQPRRDLHFQLHLRCDPSLDPLRGEAWFRELLVDHPPPVKDKC